MIKKHLLIIHPSFCIRAKKQVEGLISESIYYISIITDIKKSHPQITNHIKNNTTIIPFNFHRNVFFRYIYKIKLKRLIKNVDIIHCHNEPNYHVVDTINICAGKIPIIYDIHDFTSMRNGKKYPNEQIAYEKSDMIIHVSKDFINYGNNLYKQKPCKVILSTPPKKYIIQNNQTKKYEKKNEYHFVYQGGLFDPSWKNKIQFSYRNYYNIFESILQEGYHVHLYTSVNEKRLPSYMKLKNDYIKFHFHGQLKYDDLINEMSNYDFGLAGFNLDNIKTKSAINYLNAAMGNKMFDYFCSGLPVITFNAKAMTAFVKANNCGFEKKEDIPWSTIIKQNINRNNIYKVSNKYCMENQIGDLINIYEELVN